MKKPVLQSTALAGLALTPVWSQTMGESEGTLTVTPSFVSAYMFRGVRLGGLSFQPVMDYSKGPLGLELFANFPLQDKILGVCDPEIDLSASYTWKIVPNVFSVKPCLVLQTYPTAEEDEGFYKATLEAQVYFGFHFGEVEFSCNFFYDFVLEGPTYEVDAKYLLPLKQNRLNLELSATVGRYDWFDSLAGGVVKTRNSGNYFQAGVALPYEFSKRSFLRVGWCYAEGTNNYFHYTGGKRSNADAIGKGFFIASYSYSF